MKNYIHPIKQLGQYRYGREDTLANIAINHGVSVAHVCSHRMPAIHPDLDDEGYPTEQTLLAIEHWPITSNFAIKDLLNYVMEAWHGEKSAKVHGLGTNRHIALSTWGWSGNESIIHALEKNRVFWLMCWLESRRGGHYKFLTAPIKK